MSILTTIDGIPLYSSVVEALTWANDNNQQGYHTHVYNGITGYMGGYTHTGATANVTVAVAEPFVDVEPEVSAPVQPVAPTINTQPTPSPTPAASPAPPTQAPVVITPTGGGQGTGGGY
tara:strand:+ start:1786 stop:2142 length:357 start_codon:yes stop_codon:yes gene_type:complete